MICTSTVAIASCFILTLLCASHVISFVAQRYDSSLASRSAQSMTGFHASLKNAHAHNRNGDLW